MTTPRWPAPKMDLIQTIAAKGPTLAELREMSPVMLTHGTPNTELILDALFPGNPLLHIGWAKNAGHTWPRDDFRRKLSKAQYIVPSPMSAPTGPRKRDGQEAIRTEANVGPRHYLITESDLDLNYDAQAAILHHLARFAPLVMVVNSARRSLHGWFYAK